jgi:hypothetical protein
VSFALTHWCADRGLRGADFDEEFALALRREINLAAGNAEDAELGELPDTGVRVLRARGLVAQAYRCKGIEAVTTALLEHGSLLAPLSWQTSFMTPKQVAGTAVAVRAADAQLAGGHAVLLDGIDLDLEIDGVKGFARFKNSWGREWGDHGHCLISLADLEPVLDESFLLIPAAAALRTGVSADVAIEGDPPAVAGLPSQEDIADYGEQAIGSDRWTTRDAIGYAAHAEAIARAICHEETSPPLTIGIKGPWGAGKTSLMRMVRERLEWPTGRPADAAPDARRPIDLAAKVDRRVTNGMVLDEVRSATSADVPTARPVLTASHASEEERRWRPTVWFNPWMYQTGEQVWAGLVHEIIEQVTDRMTRAEQEYFWLRLNLKRIDEHAVRRRIYGLVAGRVVPWAIGGLIALVAGIVCLAAGVPVPIGAALAAAGPAAVVAATVAKLRGVLGERARGALTEALGPNAFAELVRSPDYERQSGPLFLVRADLQRVLDLVARPKRPLVVFVDDLDRCNPGTVVQVIEAINLFVAGEYPNTIFVVAMEPEMVAAHIEAAYGDLVKQLAASGGPGRQAYDLGWRFLEKVVQLPLTLPTVGATRARGFVASLFSPAAADTSAEAVPDEVAVRIAEQQLQDAGSVAETAERVGSVARPDVPGGAEAVKEAARRILERRLSYDSPEVQAVVEFAADHLDDNPREIKRFVNVFRYFVMIAMERRFEGIGDPVPLKALAKMAILLVRWPGLLDLLTRTVEQVDGRPTVLTLLESSTDADATAKSLTAEGLPAPVVAALVGHELADLLEKPPFIGRLTDGFL